MMPETPSIIFISLENWDDIWRRNQFICAELARRWKETKILFVGLPIDVSGSLRRQKLDRLTFRSTYSPPGLDNITVTRPLKLAPNSFSAGRLINETFFRRHVAKIAKQLGIIHPLLWINAHSASHMAGRMKESGLIYDVTDDWTAVRQSTRLRTKIARQDAELCSNADAVIVCSERLLKMKQRLSSRVHLIPNGVSVEHYATVVDREGPLPVESRGWPKPVFGYTGTIHPDRVDLDLVAALAEQMGAGSLVFVGPNYLSKSAVAKLTARGNVLFVGPVPYERIPEYMRAFDVCIVPHRVSEFTESLNPIKLWEYLAAGKPIVSTDVAGFRDYPQLVAVAKSADEFISAMLAGLTEEDSKRKSRQKEAGAHSWAVRVDEIEQLLLGLVACRRETVIV